MDLSISYVPTIHTSLLSSLAIFLAGSLFSLSDVLDLRAIHLYESYAQTKSSAACVDRSSEYCEQHIKASPVPLMRRTLFLLTFWFQRR